MQPAELLSGRAGDILLLCDHASNHVPAEIDLAIDPTLLELHIGYDIGAGPLTRSLAARMRAPAVLGTVSRLVIDLHREPDHPGLIPVASDGHPIPGNAEVDPADRIARFHAPYHQAIEEAVVASDPRMIVAIHSFTQRLKTEARDRPWQVGILYNEDARLAHLAIDAFRSAGIVTGDNEPYSGRLLNATLNRHAEAHGIASVSLEVRNDLIADAAGVARWAEIVHSALDQVRNGLAQTQPSAT